MKAEGPNVAQELRLPKRSPGFAATLTRSLALYLAVLFIGALALVYSQLLNTFITWPSIPNFLPSIGLSSSPRPAPSTFQMQADANITELQNLPSTPPMASNKDQSSSPTCPEYFRWIHEDLRPWRETGGVTREAVEKARSKAHFRLLVVDGRVYVKQYKKAFQTRDLFSIWGILQLLRRYPGQVPDLDLMFNCNDHPGVPKSDYNITIDPASPARPPPVFSYCADAATFDLVFPDWSFWGWPEVNAKPWKQSVREARLECPVIFSGMCQIQAPNPMDG